MRLASYILSLILHAVIILLVFFWPTKPIVRLDPQAVMISLVEGDMGGNKTPSNILGHMGEPGEKELAPTPPAPKQEIAAPAREEVKESTAVKNVPPKEVSKVEKKEVKKEPEKPKVEPKKEPEKPKVEPKKEAKPVEKKKEVKPEPKEKKQEVKEKAEKDKPKEKDKDKDKKEEKKSSQKEEPRKGKSSSEDAVAQALRQAKREASSRAESGDRGNAVEQALAQAKRQAGGTRGGGGGEGRGPGGGGLGDVYRGQVMLAVRPNWGFASNVRKNLVCLINVKVDMSGKVQEAKIIQSSGNAQFDNSAVSAIWRTSNGGNFPPPPSQAFTDLDLSFSLNELMGR